MIKNLAVVNYHRFFSYKSAVVNYHLDVFSHFHMFQENNGSQKKQFSSNIRGKIYSHLVVLIFHSVKEFFIHKIHFNPSKKKYISINKTNFLMTPFI